MGAAGCERTCSTRAAGSDGALGGCSTPLPKACRATWTCLSDHTELMYQQGLQHLLQAEMEHLGGQGAG